MEALGKIGTPEEAPALVSLLESENAFDTSIILDVLVKLTGVNKGLSAEAWQEYLRQYPIANTEYPMIKENASKKVKDR